MAKKNGGVILTTYPVQGPGIIRGKGPSSAGSTGGFCPVQDSPPPRSKTPEPLPPSDEELRQVFSAAFSAVFFGCRKNWGGETTQTVFFFVEFSQFY